MGIFKAYDVRGVYPSELNEALAEKIGAAIATFLNAKSIGVSHDVRTMAPSVSKALIKGITSTGADVVFAGLTTTPMNYFLINKYKLGGGVMVTASHNPPEYIGFKMSREKAIPLSEDTGIRDIEKLTARGPFKKSAKPGKITVVDLKKAYKKHILSMAGRVRPLNVVIDTANGVVGTVLPSILKELPIKVTELFFEPDGNFPNHEPNPLKDENIIEIRKIVKRQKADLGVAFDGDGDRCIFIDNKGERVSNDLIVAVIAKEFLKKKKGSPIMYDLRSSWVVKEEIEKFGGKPVQERVGHAFMKATLRKLNAPFGGELSGHCYYKEHFFTDSGLVSFMKMLTILSANRKSFSDILKPLRRYHSTGEINFHIEDKDGKIEELKRIFKDGRQSTLDGISVEYSDWWFNVRKSNTEPLLRLTMEAKTAAKLSSAKKKLFGLLGTPEA